MTVTALLVSHDGASWLPAVLDGLAAQTRRADRWVAVDTGSSDASRRLLRDGLGDYAVTTAQAHSSFGAAVRLALNKVPVPEDTEDPDWIWLLHDDSNSAAASTASGRVIGVMLPGYPEGVLRTVWPVETPTAY